MKKMFILAAITMFFGCARAKQDSKVDFNKLGNPISLDDIVNRYGSAQKAFDSVLSLEDKVVIDFYANGCVPCKNLTPVIKQLADEFPNILFLKVNIDRFSMISKPYNIRGIPTLLFYKNGIKVDQATGYMNKNNLKAKINRIFY